MQKSRRPLERLVLVFDADSGRLGALIDSAKKLLRINGCTLCSLTHGLAGEKDEWTSCREAMGVPVDYLHRDELDPRLRDVVGDDLPCVLAQSGGRTELLMGPRVLERCGGSVADFRGRLIHHTARLGLMLELDVWDKAS